MEKGSYTCGKKYGFLFIKKIKPLTEIETSIYDNLNCNYKIVKKYVNDIKKCGINCANVYYVSKNIIIERFIDGITIDQYINSNIDDNKKIEVIKRILDLFKFSLENSNLRIDWNLNNFIFHDDKIILVDYIPCLYVNNLEKINNSITKDLFELYNNIDIQLAGIIGYSIVPFLNYDKDKLKDIYEDIFSYANKIYKINKNNKHIFLDKIFMLDNYLSTNLNKDAFINNYKNLSLSKKMRNNLKQRS